MKYSRRGKIQFLAVFLFLVILIPTQVKAWDTNIGHPEIVSLGVEVYNNQFEQKITAEQLEWLKAGASQEDTPTRWFNHFYDPINNKGFKGLWSKSPDWAVNSSQQIAYALGDKSWFRAIDLYKKGDYKEAFKSLGHVLHLIADASVPAHVRDDSHPEGDSLEQFVKYNWPELQKYLPVGEYQAVSSLYDAFYNSANYANTNFYSDDTIESDDYNIINTEKAEFLIYNGKKFYFFNSKKVNNLKLFYAKGFADWKDGHYEESLKNSEVLLSYSQHLLPQSSGYTAGVIKLFLDETAKDQEVKLSKKASEGVWGWLNHQIGNVIGVVKELVGTDDFYNPILLPAEAESGLKISDNTNQDYIDPSVPQDDSGIILLTTSTLIKPTAVVSTTPVIPTSAIIIPTPPVIPTEVEGSLNNIYLVKRIIDGDTFEIEVNGENQSVRLVGIDTPEKNKCFFEQAKNKAEELLLRQQVKLVNDSIAEDKDQYGRLLRYVYRVKDNLFFNQTMVSNGYAKEYNFKGLGYDFVSDFELAEISAKTNNLGLWSACYENDDANSYVGGGYTTSVEDDVITPTSTTPAPTSTPPIDDEDEDDEDDDDENNNGTNTSTDPNTGGGTTTTTPTPDITPPCVPELTVQNNSGYNSTEILITASSTDDYSENLYYDLEFSTNTLNWLTHAVSSTQNQFSFLGSRGQSYYFRARAEDESQNISAWSEVASSTVATQINWSQDVIINEIAWSGSSYDPNAEWLEFYNNTESDINLAGWFLEFSGRIIRFRNTVNTIIPAHGYYLVERTSDRTIIKVDGDSFYTGELNNNGERVLLKNAVGEIIDEVNCSPTASGWFAGDNSGGYPSMERLNSLVSGNLASNWQSSQGDRKAEIKYGGNLNIYGSPKASNFGNIVLTGTQIEDLRILTKINNPYILDSYSIPLGKVLQSESGVIIKSSADSSRLRVWGNLKILGTAEEKVIMTSGRDVSLMDYPNKIGNYAEGEPMAQDWVGLTFENGSSGELSGLDFRYGGAKVWSGTNLGTFVYNAIVVDNANLSISDASFYNSGGYTINSLNSNIEISRASFDTGVQAMYMKTSNLILNDLEVKNFTSESGVLEFFDNFPVMNNLVLTDNINNRIRFERVVLTKDETLSNQNQYVLAGFTVPTSTILTIEPGVDMQMHPKTVLLINGSLQAQGLLGQEINIHSITPSGSWGHVEFNNSNSVLDYVNIFDGKLHYPNYAGNNGMVIAHDSQVNFTGCLINNIFSAGNLVLSNNSTLIFTDSIIGEDEKYNGWINTGNYTAGVELNGGELVLNNTEFRNLNVGIFGFGVVETLPILDVSSVSFNNVDVNWFPATWIGFSTPE